MVDARETVACSDASRERREGTHRVQTSANFSVPQYGHRMVNQPDVTITYVRKDNAALQWFNRIEERYEICHMPKTQSIMRLSWLMTAVPGGISKGIQKFFVWQNANEAAATSA